MPLAELSTSRPITLEQAAAGRPVNLWATWCGPCRAELPALAAAQQRDASVAILFANQGERAETVQAYLARERIELRDVLLDERSTLGPRVGFARPADHARLRHARPPGQSPCRPAQRCIPRRTPANAARSPLRRHMLPAP